MTNRTHIAAAFALSLGVLFADAGAFSDRQKAFNKITEKSLDFAALNKSLENKDVLYGKKDGKKNEKSYTVCYTKDGESNYVVKVHPKKDLVGKKVKDVDYKDFKADDVVKVLEMFYKTDLNKETEEYTLGTKKTAFIVYKKDKDLCALVNDKG
ncbi:MAG: hypothetical protein FADNKDHG_01546 [Holosporales bacterium]